MVILVPLRILGRAVRSMGSVVQPLTIAGMGVRRRTGRVVRLAAAVVLTRIYAVLRTGAIAA